MKILVIGSGGREHALAWKLAQCSKIDTVFVAPGNGGTARDAVNVPIQVDDIEGLVRFAKEYKVNMVIPGPELPLILGIADAMEGVGISCFGPSKWCAQLEGSKSFAKKIMVEAGVPTARYGVFQDIGEAKKFVKTLSLPLVIKADGLAGGKGVVIAHTEEEAFTTLEEIMVGKIFGDSGSTVVIEEFLEGEEVSLIAFCSGERAVVLPSVQDHKAAFTGDKGPNTGGMGAYTPAPIAPRDLCEEIMQQTITPILKLLAQKGHPYRGMLYAGLMLTKDGPKVLEYNIRFGDPECQPLLMSLKSDLFSIIQDCCSGVVSNTGLHFFEGSSLGVVVAADGYPGEYVKGMDIQGIEQVDMLPGTKVFHAGTMLQNGELYATGGRILSVVANGSTTLDAQQRVYAALNYIKIDKSWYRMDIGSKGIRREQC